MPHRVSRQSAWRGFFASFPDYRNVFATAETNGDTVAITGHSECSVPELAGPVRWDALSALSW
jgi:hypothetical protein